MDINGIWKIEMMGSMVGSLQLPPFWRTVDICQEAIITVQWVNIH